METATRPLTIEEMYFKKAIKPHIPLDSISGSTNNSFMKPDGQLSPIELKSNLPGFDLTDKVFVEPAFPEIAGMFIKKNWVWLLLGTSVVITCIVVYKKNKKKKQQNQLPITSPY